MQMSSEIHELAAALAKAQTAIGHASKDRVNPAFKSRYADLASVLDACRDALAAQGLSVVQAPTTLLDGGVCVVSVETLLVHASGQWMSTSMSAVTPDAKPQTIGSAITYLRRYGLSAVASVAADDDDGQAASQPRQPPITPVRSVREETLEDLVAATEKMHTRWPTHTARITTIADGQGTIAERMASLRRLHQELAS